MVTDKGTGLGQKEGGMKVLVLDDKTWELAKKKLEDLLRCCQTDVALVRAFRRRHGVSSIQEAYVRKRHWEAIRLAKILKQ
jgi:hypothetical protein